MNTFKQMQARDRALDKKIMKALGISEADIENKRTSLDNWTRVWPTITGTIWLNHTYDTELLCIPFNERNRVVERRPDKEIYVLLAKDAKFIGDAKQVKTISNKSKKKVKRLTVDEAIKASEKYNVYYVPVTSSTGLAKWRPEDICDSSNTDLSIID